MQSCIKNLSVTASVMSIAYAVLITEKSLLTGNALNVIMRLWVGSGHPPQSEVRLATGSVLKTDSQ